MFKKDQVSCLLSLYMQGPPDEWTGSVVLSDYLHCGGHCCIYVCLKYGQHVAVWNECGESCPVWTMSHSYMWQHRMNVGKSCGHPVRVQSNSGAL